jgi:hypothetical protein
VDSPWARRAARRRQEAEHRAAADAVTGAMIGCADAIARVVDSITTGRQPNTPELRSAQQQLTAARRRLQRADGALRA